MPSYDDEVRVMEDAKESPHHEDWRRTETQAATIWMCCAYWW